MPGIPRLPTRRTRTTNPRRLPTRPLDRSQPPSTEPTLQAPRLQEGDQVIQYLRCCRRRASAAALG